jgi:hypothetical protein
MYYQYYVTELKLYFLILESLNIRFPIYKFLDLDEVSPVEMYWTVC